MTTQTRRVLQIVSYTGLALSIVPAFLVFGGAVTKGTYLWLMLLGMVLWFSTAIFWVKRDHLGQDPVE
jgi:hypothetical protein